MSIIRSKKYKPHQAKLMMLITLLVIVAFSVIWSTWWIRTKPFFFQTMVSRIVYEQRNIREFNDLFQPTFREILPIPQSQTKTNIADSLNTDTQASFILDTTYYYFLWNKYIQEYGMDEVDSLTIDSMIKTEMIHSAMETNSTEDQNNTSISIKKEELIYVISLKPLAQNPERFSTQDSLEFAEKQNFTYTVEFWRSPLNYEGHKTSGNMIIIYGISEFNDISIRFISRDSMALRIESKLYAIKNNGQFYTFKESQIK